ncbi:hypothetical protein [Streptomyces halobius]|uniref:Uncharacterized protein n=1 Tax=Streptomyces halobius TaxID=2879846 RepID=A0ABY4MJ39_9ACTN|nr:hypothetical protein [Streptomyces halobius]UQA97578.1 hypothetical protein K9S39_00535 [Streptomyces halobius]
MATLRTVLTTASATAALAVGATTPLTATATAASATTTASAPVEMPQPAFLSAAQMPPSLTPWTAEPVADGVPEFEMFCSPDVLPSEGTRHRTFRTELDTGGVQVTTVAKSRVQAVELVSALRRALAGCGERIEREYPDTDADSRYHGKVAVEEGAYVYSLDSEDREVGATDIHLFSVGRDGRTVTYVQWGQMGDLKDAPLKDFKTTVRTAVNKLYR